MGLFDGECGLHCLGGQRFATKNASVLRIYLFCGMFPKCKCVQICLWYDDTLKQRSYKEVENFTFVFLC
jgi:hypothetical protein